MAEDTIKYLVFGAALTAVIAWILFSFLIGGAAEYGVDSSGLGGSSYGVTNFNSTLSNLTSTADNAKTAFNTWNPLKILGGIFGFVLNIISFLFLPFQLISDMAQNVIGIPSTILNVIWSILVVAIAFGLWRLWKQGD